LGFSIFTFAALLLAASIARAGEPAQMAATLATAACGSCHSLEIVVQKQTASEHDRARRLVENVCTLCHEFARVQRQELTKAEWAGEIRGMLAEGAPLTDEEFELVVNYLTRTYGVKERRP
jgi:hypothetical protein